MVYGTYIRSSGRSWIEVEHPGRPSTEATLGLAPADEMGEVLRTAGPLESAPAVQQAPAVDVTVVLPCYNESGHVLRELQRISAALTTSGLSHEVLVVDDGSTDGTLDLLRGALGRFPALRVLALGRNCGSGVARRVGTQQARGHIVVWTDADMSYPNERIPEFVRHLQRHQEVDQVVGARTSEEGTHKWARVPAKWFIRMLAGVLCGMRIPDLNSGFRAFRREVSLPYLRLLPPGFSCVTTLTLSFLSDQHVVEYLPIDYAQRAGRSKFHPFRDAYRYLLQVLRMVMYFNPLKILMPVALTLFAAGFLKLGLDVARYSWHITPSTLLILFGGFQIAVLGLIGDLVVRSRA